jgi:hypothetical protein
VEPRPAVLVFFPEPHRFSDQQDIVGLDDCAIRRDRLTMLDPHDRTTGADLDPSGRQVVPERGADLRVVGGHQVVSGHQREAQPLRIVLLRPKLGAQTVAGRQEQLDPAGAAADHQDPPRLTVCQAARLQRLELGKKAADRFHGEGVFRRTRNGSQRRRRADVERQQIVGERGPALDQNTAERPIDARRGGPNQARVREPGERLEVDVALLEAVVAGDQAGSMPE